MPIPPTLLKEKGRVLLGKSGASNATKRPRGDVVVKTPTAAEAPKEIPTPSKKEIGLIYVSKADSLKDYGKTTGGLVKDEIPKEFQEKLAISKPRSSNSLEGAKGQVDPDEGPRWSESLKCQVKGDKREITEHGEEKIDASE